MSSAVKIASWVRKKPLILIRFDAESSERLLNAKNASRHFTLAKPHSVFQNFKVPTICLLETLEYEGKSCYLATVTRKAAISTFDSRLTIKGLRAITQSSLQEITGQLTDRGFRNSFTSRLPNHHGASRLSPELSAHIVELLAQDPKNQYALETALSTITGLRPVHHTDWAQTDAIESAMAVFGIRANEIPDELVTKRDTEPGLGMIDVEHVFEDNVIRADASQLPGFDAIAPDIKGRAVFVKGDERLVIYTANRLPLERMFGVDLIYINETRGNIVMVQYKMLEEHINNGKSRDWLFRPNNRLWKEIARMNIPSNTGTEHTDYRLSNSPFFFKFVKRKHVLDDSPKFFFVSLDHLIQILESPEGQGPRCGIRLSYETLDGTYLRNTDMIGLIRSGYVGTHRADTQALARIISEGAKGNNAVVLAWQKRIQGDVSFSG